MEFILSSSESESDTVGGDILAVASSALGADFFSSISLNCLKVMALPSQFPTNFLANFNFLLQVCLVRQFWRLHFQHTLFFVFAKSARIFSFFITNLSSLVVSLPMSRAILVTSDCKLLSSRTVIVYFCTSAR